MLRHYTCHAVREIGIVIGYPVEEIVKKALSLCVLFYYLNIQTPLL